MPPVAAKSSQPTGGLAAVIQKRSIQGLGGQGAGSGLNRDGQSAKFARVSTQRRARLTRPKAR